jgi:hypothetical protein
MMHTRQLRQPGTRRPLSCEVALSRVRRVWWKLVEASMGVDYARLGRFRQGRGEAPIIYGYFYNHLSASAKNVAGVYPTASGDLFLNKTVKT